MVAFPFRPTLAVIFGTTLLAANGCGGPKELKLYPAKGKVLLGGKPLEGLTVVLSPIAKDGTTAVALGRTGADGDFTLSTYKPGDGAAAGEYIVLVQHPIDDEM